MNLRTVDEKLGRDGIDLKIEIEGASLTDELGDP